MDLFGLNRFFTDPPDGRPPKKGPGRYFEVLYDHLGALLGCNFLTFIGFLPLALGVSLGLVMENLWLTLITGAVGGAIAGPFWAAMTAVALQSFRGSSAGWFGRWRGSLLPAAAQGAALGLLASGFLMVGSFFSALLGGGNGPAAPVWVVILFDLYLLSLAATLLFPSLPVCAEPLPGRLKRALSMIPLAPGRVLGTGLALLVWCALLVGLFPVSVPLSVLLGFWPMALLSAQLLLPPLSQAFELEDGFGDAPGTSFALRANDRPGGLPTAPGTVIAPSGQRPSRQPSAAQEIVIAPSGQRPVRQPSAAQRGEIWWRRRWPLVLAIVVCLGLLSGVLGTMIGREEPDLQIAIVHAEALPDGVLSALERSLADRVGDLNGDGAARVIVNDYTVVFDGSAADSDLQTAGMARLVTDVAAGDSALFAVADPAGFLANYGDRVDADAAVLWADCPGLAGLDAGTFSTVEDIYTDVDGQTLLAGLTVLPAHSANGAVFDLFLTF